MVCLGLIYNNFTSVTIIKPPVWGNYLFHRMLVLTEILLTKCCVWSQVVNVSGLTNYTVYVLTTNLFINAFVWNHYRQYSNSGVWLDCNEMLFLITVIICICLISYYMLTLVFYYCFLYIKGKKIQRGSLSLSQASYWMDTT